MMCCMIPCSIVAGRNVYAGYRTTTYQTTRCYKPEGQNIENQKCRRLRNQSLQFRHPGLDFDFTKKTAYWICPVIPSIVVEWPTLLFCVLMVAGLIFGPDTLLALLLVNYYNIAIIFRDDSSGSTLAFFFHIVSNSVFTNLSAIRHYMYNLSS
jgi:hypothetical protein